MPACGFQLGGCFGGIREGDARLLGSIGKEGADAGDGNAGEATRHPGGGRCGEEEFVVFAAVECGVEGLVGGKVAGERMEWDCGGVDVGP